MTLVTRGITVSWGSGGRAFASAMLMNGRVLTSRVSIGANFERLGEFSSDTAAYYNAVQAANACRAHDCRLVAPAATVSIANSKCLP